MPRLIPPPHPGETILEEVLKPLDMSVNQLANNLGVTATRLNDIVRGRRGVTADTALRLARYLGTSAEFWLGLQLEYDLRIAKQAKMRSSAPCGRGPKRPKFLASHPSLYLFRNRKVLGGELEIRAMFPEGLRVSTPLRPCRD